LPADAGPDCSSCAESGTSAGVGARPRQCGRPRRPAQGYFFGKPMPAAEFQTWMAAYS